MIASKNGSVEIVRALVQHGASVNHTNKVSYNSFQSVYTVTCHTPMCPETACWLFLSYWCWNWLVWFSIPFLSSYQLSSTRNLVGFYSQIVQITL